MSNAIFPVLPGLTWDVVKTPIFNTVTKKAVTGRETRIAYMATPMYSFKLVFEYLRDDMSVQVPASPFNHLKLLMGFFIARQGSFDSFLFDDNTDDLATAQQFGTGTGAKTTFQLARTYGGGTGFLEPVMNLNGTPSIYVNGTLTTPSSISSTGVVTFTAAPASGAILTWTGNYYFRCRFDTDTSDFQQFMLDYWTNGGLILYGSLSNKL
jgi:uncharacterized protein (TIGR02217 family)